MDLRDAAVLSQEQNEVTDSAYLGSESNYSECETFTDEDTGTLVHQEMHEEVETDSAIDAALSYTEEGANGPHQHRLSLGSELNNHSLVTVISGEEEHFEDFGEGHDSELLPDTSTMGPIADTSLTSQLERSMLLSPSSSKRLSSSKVARHLHQTSILTLDGMEDLSRDIMELAETDMTDKVMFLEERVAELEKDSAANVEQHTRLRQENLQLVHRANALEEQLKEQESRSEEALLTEIRWQKEVLCKVERERSIEIENLQARFAHYYAAAPDLVGEGVINSAPDEDAEEDAEAPAPICTNADAVLRGISSFQYKQRKEDNFLNIIDARDKKAFEGFPFHEAVWKPIGVRWERSASATACPPRVDTFYRVPTGQRDHLFKLPKLDTILATPGATPSSRPLASDRADKKVDTYLKRSYTGSTCGMRVSNSQTYAAKYQHKLWGQLSAALQTPNPENIELAMQLEEDKNVSKTHLQAGCDAIDTNARAVQTCVTIEIKYQAMDGTMAAWNDGEFLGDPNRSENDGTFQFETDSLLSGHSQGSAVSPGRSHLSLHLGERSIRKLQQLDEENSELRSCVPCLRANIERLEEERRKLQDQVEDVTLRMNEELESQGKMADRLAHERHKNQKEKESTQVLIEDLRKQLEFLQLYKLEAEARCVHSASAGLQEYNSRTREAELEQEVRRLKQDNCMLKEQNDELNGQIINLSIQGAKNLFSASFSESLAAEINSVSRDELMEAIHKQKDINLRLQEYIDGIIVAIMESNPSILEVK
ncbi:UNVERIFIED_CONTAM: hypothetical protein FKN15_070152 [Acipenser sinensis]